MNNKTIYAKLKAYLDPLNAADQYADDCRACAEDYLCAERFWRKEATNAVRAMRDLAGQLQQGQRY